MTNVKIFDYFQDKEVEVSIEEMTNLTIGKRVKYTETAIANVLSNPGSEWQRIRSDKEMNWSKGTCLKLRYCGTNLIGASVFCATVQLDNGQTSDIGTTLLEQE